MGASGVNDGVHNLGADTTFGQKVCIAAQFGYALASVVALAALMSHRPGARPLLWIWAALLSLTAGLASVVWGGTGPIIGLVAALFTGAVAAGIVWLALEGWKDGATERR